MIVLHDHAGVNDNEILPRQLCCNNVLSIMKTFFHHRDVHKWA